MVTAHTDSDQPPQKSPRLTANKPNVGNVLIIEDETPLRRALTMKLQSAGYSVSTATDGKMGLEKAVANLPDLILLDLMLPKMNGMDVLQRIRGNPSSKHIPIIILTNSSGEVSQNAALKHGAPAYFTKSDVSLNEVLRAVDFHLRDNH